MLREWAVRQKGSMPKDRCPPGSIARWFINRTDRGAGDDMTHLRLQKLIYFAQAWHLANTGEPLFQEDMQAWTHGPVVPSIWHAYRQYHWDPIPAGPDPKLDHGVVEYLELIYGHYGKYTAKELEKITHQDDPWRATRGSLPLEAACSTPIDQMLMRDFHGEKIGKRWQ
jgi:uncharacterized phage-associated protein